MPRIIIKPQATVTEEIRSIEEYPPDGIQPGMVRVSVGVVGEDGRFVVPQQYQSFEITDADYGQLTGKPGPWAPNKPAGTYRNDDLWHFIDLLRQRSLGSNTVLGGA